MQSLEELRDVLLAGLPAEAMSDLEEEVALLPAGTPLSNTIVLGLRARLEARWSWASWTDEDVERERWSWKALVE